MRTTPFPLTLRQLQYAVAVAEELHFRRAAERCGVSQPSLSAQIAELEDQLGVQLFERDRRRVLVTRAGAELVARARAVLVQAEDLVEAATQRRDLLSGTLHLGVIPTIGPYLLPDLSPALARAFPALQVRWVEEKTETLVRKIEAGELAGALLALEADIGALETEVVGRDAFVVAVPRAHRFAGRSEPVDPVELLGEDVLLLDDGHCFRDQTLELCTTAGARELGFRATSLPTLVQMVAGGAGATLLPSLAVEVENRRGTLEVRRFGDPAPFRTIGMAWRPGSPWSEPLCRVAEVVRAALEERPA